MPRVSFPVTGDDVADQLLVDDPLALLIGMLLDQQVPMEWAFRGPATLRDRLGGLDAAAIAAMTPEALDEVFRTKPALHRFPSAMAKRTHALCVHLVEHYDGDAARIWRRVKDPEVVYDRLRALPGLRRGEGPDLARHPREAPGQGPGRVGAVRGPFGDPEPRSVADIDSREAFARVRAWKKEQKAKGRAKSE